MPRFNPFWLGAWVATALQLSCHRPLPIPPTEPSRGPVAADEPATTTNDAPGVGPLASEPALPPVAGTSSRDGAAPSPSGGSGAR
jgi:hypothetical protein